MTANASIDDRPPGASAPAEMPTPTEPAAIDPAKVTVKRPKEVGGPTGPEPTRYGDWEHNGRCIDF